MYQLGVVRRVPELPFLEADAVNASGEAHQAPKTPDAALALVSVAAARSWLGRATETQAGAESWLLLALAAETTTDVAGAGLRSAGS